MTDFPHADSSTAEDKFRTYIENAPDGVFISDAMGRYIEVNPAACRITGYSSDELLNSTIADMLPTGEVESGLMHFQRLREEGRSSGEMKFVTKGGETRWWSVDAVKLSEDRYMGFVKDITDRKDAEAALLRSERIHRQLMDLSPVGVVIVSKGRIAFANPAACALFRANDQRQLIGRQVLEGLVHPEFAESLRENLQHVLETGETMAPRQIQLITLDGRIIDVEASGASIDFSGGRAQLVALVDVTQRAAMERSLRESSFRFRSVVENMLDAFLRADLTGRITDASPSAAKLYGFEKASDLIGMDVNNVYSDEAERARVLALISERGELRDELVKGRRMDGSLLWVSLNAKFLRDEAGNVTGTEGIARDVTPRMEEEYKRAQAEMRLRVAVEASGLGVLEYDIENDRLTWDGRSHELWGVEEGELVTIQEALTRIHEEDRDRVEEVIEKAFDPSGDGYAHVRFRMTHGKDGGERVLEGYGRTVFQEGRPVFFYGTHMDVTERIREEERKKRDAIRYSLALEATGLGVQEYDVAADKVFWDDQTYKLWGIEPGTELSMEKCLEGILPEDMEAVKERIAKCFDPAGDGRVLVRFRVKPDKNGVIRVLESYGRAFFAEGRPSVFYGIHRDVTAEVEAAREHSELQAKFHHAQKMESIGRLAGGVAHDYNNILGIIIGNAEMALTELTGDSPLRECVSEILTAARHSAQITRQLLAFARKQAISPRVVDLNGAVETALKMLRRLVGEDIELTWSPGSHLKSVRIDPSQLDQILANLAINSRDAITGVGRISIQTHGASVGAEEAARIPEASVGNYVVLSFADSGCGIAPEARDHIFEPFYTTKPTGEGTGLGLATVQGLVIQSGGFVDFSSEPGEGTVFRIHLPAVNPEEAIQVGGPESAAPGGDETVLVVEDEPAALKMVKKILTRLGYRALCAESPEEALKISSAHEGAIHLVLTDMIMPGMSGTDLAARLRAERPEARVLYMSGYPADARGGNSQLLEAGAHYLAKPFNMAELAEKVRSVLDS